MRFFAAFACFLLMGEVMAMEHPVAFEGIHKDGVGMVRLGHPVPKDLLPKDAESAYVAGYYADAQPYEGFKLATPPVTVFLDRGPFLRAAKTEAVADPKGRGPDALRAARRGAKVKCIVVESEVLKTPAGVGKGSPLKALREAYPDLQLSKVPATFGQDECVASSRTLPSVFFYFPTCEAAEQGAGVSRIMLFRE